MEIRNLMEDLVIRIVQETCDDEETRRGTGGCPDPASRPDIACYVLNRIPQRYVSSGRGAAHAERSWNENPQLLVDITTLVNEGIHRVSRVRRPYYGQTPQADSPGSPRPDAPGPVFVFPVIKGRVLDCRTFAPLARGAVHLLAGGERVAMIDRRWQNPFALDPKIEGTFLFLPRPQEAEGPGERRLFDFEILVEDPDYEPLRHFFTIALSAGSPWPGPEPVEPPAAARAMPDADPAVRGTVRTRTGPDFKLADIFAAPK